MAVTVPPLVAADGGAGVRPGPVRVRYFVRLKLRIIGNGLRASAGRVVAFAFGLLLGMAIAAGGFAAFLASGLVGVDAGLVLAVCVGSLLVFGWVLVPVLFFGVDETLDPARFALYPLPRRTLAVGMLAAACVGIPAAATALALAGLVYAGATRAGAGGALVGLLGAVLSLVVCVLASRAVTSALAALLRSRRMRDLTGVVVALLGASIGPLNLFLRPAVQHASLTPLLGLARVLAWTPLGAGFATPYDVAAGRPLLAVARLAILVATAGLLLWWWSRTIESAMVGTVSGPSGRRAATGGAVATLLPWVLRHARPSQYLAILARELRSWSRDPNRRGALISITVGSCVVPIAVLVASERNKAGPTGLPISIALACALSGSILANQFGFDGGAYATHLLAGVPGRTDLLARITGLAMLIGPVLLVVASVTTLVGGTPGQLPQSVGLLVAGMGGSLSLASFISVYAAFPAERSGNPFARSSGSGSARGLLTFVGIIGTAVLTAPLVVVLLLLPA
ncbi:MAG: ABC transporter permease, partial [Micromonosporaceae bacterium]|nr:ABC transporter permease [Micromonosporaceae bacterium]